MSLSPHLLPLAALTDETRVRLLAVLVDHEMTVAEMVAVLGVPQSRVSTHLGRLRDAGLLRDRSDGPHRYYRVAGDDMPAVARAAWESLRAALARDPSLRSDRRRRDEILRARSNASWADRVAGSLERHYSPGRTWEALARGLLLTADLGRVVDIGAGDGAIAELLAPQARQLVCIDVSARMAEAGHRRVDRGGLRHVRFLRADMEALPVRDGAGDTALMQQTLQYARDPEQAVREAARILRPAGRLLVVTLATHGHGDVRDQFGHRHLGFSTAELRRLATRANLGVVRIASAGRERKSPHFEALAMLAVKDARNGRSKESAAA